MIIIDRIEVAAQMSVDGKMYELVNNKHVPWSDAAAFLERIPKTRRHKGQTCWCMFEGVPSLYQFVEGVEDEHLVRLGGTIKGTAHMPSDEIMLPAGKFYREILLTGTGFVKIGTTPAGGETLDTLEIAGDDPYVANLSCKPSATKTFYITSENDFEYEIFIG